MYWLDNLLHAAFWATLWGLATFVGVLGTLLALGALRKLSRRFRKNS